jgi:hypothetical protein
LGADFQMERTVELEENSEVLKDLEMLRSKAQESSGDDASPDSDPVDMNVFSLQGGNPLHQLGLFMKEDDNEEESQLWNKLWRGGPDLVCLNCL